MNLLFLIWNFFICIVHTLSKDLTDIRYRGPSEKIFYSTVPDCYSKFVGLKGTVQSPVLTQEYEYPVDCSWDVDVTDSNNIEFEFEIFKLPKRGENRCESYVELSYVKNQVGKTKRLFCPYDLVDKIYIESSTVHLRFHCEKYIEENGNDSYGFKINYIAIPEDKSTTHQAATIVLVSFAILFIITICVICIRSHRNSPRICSIPSQLMAPNAPTRADLQSAFDFHLTELTQAPQNGNRYLGRTVPDISDFTDRRNVSIPPQQSEKARDAETFIVTTPRSVFPRGGSGAASARRIADLRTRLVARFSSASSNDSDRSVFLSASSQMNYSKLDIEDEDKVPEEERPRADIRRTASCGSKNIPSIVIEFFK